MKLGDTDINILRCSCGWQYLSISGTEKKCPACRSEIKYCFKCGNIFKNGVYYCKKCKEKKDVYCPVCGNEKENLKNIFCNNCFFIDKKIKLKNMSKKIEAVKTFKEKLNNDNICNYDCFNCQFSDCILPAEKDEQGELF